MRKIQSAEHVRSDASQSSELVIRYSDLFRISIFGIVIFVLLGLFVLRADGAEIKGTVGSATDKYATVLSDSDLLPAPGDKVEIYFKMPGAGDAEVSVASGRVYEITGPNIMVEIGKATGAVAKNQLARITSPHPRKKESRAAASPIPAASSRPSPTMPGNKITVTTPASVSGSVHTPAVGTPERQAIMDVMRLDFYSGNAAAAHTNAKGIRFKVDFLKVHGNWACAHVDPTDSTGKRFAEPRWEVLMRKNGAWSDIQYFDALRPFSSEEVAQEALGLSPSTVTALRAKLPEIPGDIFPAPGL